MKLIIGIFSIISAGVVSLFFILPALDTPEEVVKSFFSMVIKGNKEAASRLITNEPEYVTRRAYGSESNSATTKSDSSSDSFAPSLSADLATKDLLDSLIPKLLISQSRTLTKIVRVNENAHEARVRVGFGNEKLADIMYDVLLIKLDGKWRIFKVMPVTELYENRSYDFFAAEPEN